MTKPSAPGPCVTLSIPIDAIGPITVTAPPPALVSKVNAGHLGLETRELVRVLRAMRADPRFRDQVIARGKSFRAAPPDAIIAFLRATPFIEERNDDDLDPELLRRAGYSVPPRRPFSQEDDDRLALARAGVVLRPRHNVRGTACREE
jgi:hypothetical protein